MAEKGRGDSSEGVTPSRSHSFGAMWASAKASHYCVVSHVQDVRKVTAAVSVAFHFRVFLESKEIRKRALKKKCFLELDLQRKSRTFESPLAQTVMKERKEKEPFVFSSFFSFFFFLFPSKNQNQPTVMRIPTPGCSRAAGRWRWLHWEGSSRAGLRVISAIFQHRRGGWQSHTDGLPLPDTSSASVTHPGRCQWLSVRYGERQSIQALFSSLRPLQADDFPLCFPWPKQKKASHKSPDCSGGFFFPPFLFHIHQFLFVLLSAPGADRGGRGCSPVVQLSALGSFSSQTWNDALTRETTQRSHCQEVGERVDLFHETKNERGREDNSATAGLS